MSHLLNGFTPSAGQQYHLFYGMSSGQFAVLDLPTFSGGAFDPEYGHPPFGFSLGVH